MPTARQCMQMLVEADDRLTAEYGNATPARKRQIDFFARVIEGVLKELVKLDLRSRNANIQKLTTAINGSNQELTALKATIESMVRAGQMAQRTLNALAALLPIL